MLRISFIAAMGLFLAAPLARAENDSAEADDPRAQRRAAMIARIDQLLADRWRQEGVEPAPPASDAEFLRRAYLDLTGVIPTVAQVREFRNDQRSDKRARLIDRLLQSPQHATHMASTWRTIMLPQGFDPQELNNAIGLQNWLRAQFVDNLRYDRLVEEFLRASNGGQTGPAVFYTSQELKPEKLAASTSRIFLGVQIQCAECHNHPFDNWTQKDFWGYAAFFGRLQGPDRMIPGQDVQLVDLDSGEVTLPGEETVVAPKFPAGRVADERATGTRRDQLAVWMASRDNPFLPRAAVNRFWAHLFGRGIVDPVDDLSKNNPASHPELFEDLSDYFVEIGFDARELLRTLASTRAYQLSSQVQDERDMPPELFARMLVKTLTAEQLYDSLSRALSRREPSRMPGTQFASPMFDPRRRTFITRMQSQTTDMTDYESGVPQALSLINGPEVNEAANPRRSALLGALQAPWFDDNQRVETLFMATLSRPPDEAERERFVEYVASGGAAGNRQQALGDVLWALLNSAEFALNH